jgi:hypothetical protein
MMHDRPDMVNMIWVVFPNLYAFITRAHRLWPASAPMTWANGPTPGSNKPYK